MEFDRLVNAVLVLLYTVVATLGGIFLVAVVIGLVLGGLRVWPQPGVRDEREQWIRFAREFLSLELEVTALTTALYARLFIESFADSDKNYERASKHLDLVNARMLGLPFPAGYNKLSAPLKRARRDISELSYRTYQLASEAQKPVPSPARIALLAEEATTYKDEVARLWNGAHAEVIGQLHAQGIGSDDLEPGVLEPTE